MIIITISLHCPGNRNLHHRMHFCWILPGIIPTRCFFWISILIFLIIHIIILVLCFFLFSEKCICVYIEENSWELKEKRSRFGCIIHIIRSFLFRMCGIVVIYGLELLCVVYCYIFLRFYTKHKKMFYS